MHTQWREKQATELAKRGMAQPVPQWKCLAPGEYEDWASLIKPEVLKAAHLFCAPNCSNHLVPADGNDEPGDAAAVHWCDINQPYEALPESWKAKNRIYAVPDNAARAMEEAPSTFTIAEHANNLRVLYPAPGGNAIYPSAHIIKVYDLEPAALVEARRKLAELRDGAEGSEFDDPIELEETILQVLEFFQSSQPVHLLDARSSRELMKAEQILEMSHILTHAFKHNTIEDTQKTWNELDTDENGRIDLDELMCGLQRTGLSQDELQGLRQKTSALYEEGFVLNFDLFRALLTSREISKSGGQVLHEIKKAGQILEMSHILGRAFKHSDLEDARRSFDIIDRDGNGMIDLDELVCGLQRSGFTSNELEDIRQRSVLLYAEGFVLDFDLFAKIVCPWADGSPDLGELLVYLQLIDQVPRRAQSDLRCKNCGVLFITVQKGIELSSMDDGGTSDPYVVLKVGDQQPQRSSVKLKTLNPVWDETFSFAVESMDNAIELEVWDQDVGLDEVAHTVMRTFVYKRAHMLHAVHGMSTTRNNRRATQAAWRCTGERCEPSSSGTKRRASVPPFCRQRRTVQPCTA